MRCGVRRAGCEVRGARRGVRGARREGRGARCEGRRPGRALRGAGGGGGGALDRLPAARPARRGRARPALRLDAAHMSWHTPRARRCFESPARGPASVGARVAAVLAHDHGDMWRAVVARHSTAWLRLADERPAAGDFYGGRLADLRVPTLLVHGARDPRTEPGELDAIQAALADAKCRVFPDGAHSPHTERTTA